MSIGGDVNELQRTKSMLVSEPLCLFCTCQAQLLFGDGCKNQDASGACDCVQRWPQRRSVTEMAYIHAGASHHFSQTLTVGAARQKEKRGHFRVAQQP